MIPYTPVDIIDQTNRYRVEQGLPAMQTDPALMKAAQLRAQDMAKTQSFSHTVATTTPNVDNWSFFKKAGYPFQHAGENLAVDFTTATDTMKAWQNSPTHKKNLVDPNYSDIGVAVVPGVYQGRQTYYVVQFFGKKGAKPRVVATPVSPQAVRTIQQVSPSKTVARDIPVPQSVAPVSMFNLPKRTIDFRVANSTPMLKSPM